MCQAISKRDQLLRRMQELTEDGVIAGQKLRSIPQGDMNHRAPHSQRKVPLPGRSR